LGAFAGFSILRIAGLRTPESGGHDQLEPAAALGMKTVLAENPAQIIRDVEANLIE
jgi:hypothetical protein